MQMTSDPGPIHNLLVGAPEWSVYYLPRTHLHLSCLVYDVSATMHINSMFNLGRSPLVIRHSSYVKKFIKFLHMSETDHITK